MFGVLETEETESLNLSEITELESEYGIAEAGNFDQREGKAGYGDHNLSEVELNQKAFEVSDGDLPAYIEDGVIQYNEPEEESSSDSITDDVGIFGQGEFNEVFNV